MIPEVIIWLVPFNNSVNAVNESTFFFSNSTHFKDGAVNDEPNSLPMSLASEIVAVFLWTSGATSLYGSKSSAAKRLAVIGSVRIYVEVPNGL